MQWRILTRGGHRIGDGVDGGVDGSEVASGDVAVFASDDHEARERAARWVEQHPPFNHRSGNRIACGMDVVVELGQIREADPDGDWDDWAEDHIYPYTGIGHTDGDSWYDVEVTASSNARLVGRTFDWGY